MTLWNHPCFTSSSMESLTLYPAPHRCFAPSLFLSLVLQCFHSFLHRQNFLWPSSLQFFLSPPPFSPPVPPSLSISAFCKHHRLTNSTSCEAHERQEVKRDSTFHPKYYRSASKHFHLERHLTKSLPAWIYLDSY